MRFIVLDIKIGSVGKKPISKDRMTFHENVAKMLFPEENEQRCLPPKFSVPLDYKELISTPEIIMTIMDDTFSIYRDIKSNSLCDLYIIDFTSNNLDLPRESLLIHIWNKLSEYFKKSNNLKFLILLKSLPSTESVSHNRLKRLKEDIGNNSVILIENSGNYISFPEDQNINLKKSKYQNYVNKLNRSPIFRLRNKLIRRLGNFPLSSKNTKETRFYSYLIDNCDSELHQILKEWWRKNKPECDAIIYDSPNLESLSISVRTFSIELDLPFYRMEDLMKSNTKLLSRASKHKRCLLILDVVGTGTTLLNYNNFLRKNNISISKNVLTAINKGTAIETEIRTKTGNFNVEGFLEVDKDPTTPIQIQRELNLPLTSDNYETYDKIRAFDFWYMAYTVGWEPETDVPDNIGYKYDIVPIFTKMLSEYGDWIAYKMEQFLKKTNHPQNFFVIHPDESGAISVSDKLKLRFNRLTIIKVPRSVIRLAQNNDNNWDGILSSQGRDENWYFELNSIRNASAIITDVFNASGSTFLSIYKLLKYLRINVFCYFPFVDRDCYCNFPQKYPVQKYSLYDWFGPRKLKKKVF